MDKSIRKNGGGAHNWGTPGDVDEAEIFDNFDEDVPPVSTATNSNETDSPKDRRGSVSTASTSSHTEEDKEKALAFRTKAFKDGSGTSCSFQL